MIILDSLSFTYSLLDSSHGGSYGKDERLTTPLDQQQYFFSRLQFPVETDIEAWTEKVSFTIIKVVIMENKKIGCSHVRCLCDSITSLSIYVMIWFIHFIGLLLLIDKKASFTAYCQGVCYGCSIQLGC